VKKRRLKKLNMVARKQMKGKQPMQSYVKPAHKSNDQGRCW